MNKPVGGIAGQATREETFDEMGQEQTPIQTGRFEYLARGGAGDAALRYTNNAVKKIKFQKQLRAFEELMAGQQKSAKALYDDAVSMYGEDIKNWVPVPELFVDESTGAFMPMKYAEAVAKGVQEYKKNSREEKRQDLAERREGRMEGYQKGQLDVAQKNAARMERQTQESGRHNRAMEGIGAERNRIARVRASKEGQTYKTEELRLLKQYEDMVIKDQEALNRINDDIRTASLQGDEKGARDAEKLRKTKVSHLMNTTRTLKKVRANMEGRFVDDKAITVAADIEAAVDGLMPPDEFEVKYGFSTERQDEATGQRVSIDESADPVALKTYMYAQSIGVKASLEGIQQAMMSMPLEDIIARINKQKKPAGIGK